MIGIYKITNLVNGKVYIGQSTNIKKRWFKHRSYNKDNLKLSLLQRAFKKYGIENFKFEVIKECSRENLNTFEEWFIRINYSWNQQYGYNLTFGGEVKNLTDEAKKKISDSHRGKTRQFSEEHKKNISTARKGLIHKNRKKVIRVLDQKIWDNTFFAELETGLKQIKDYCIKKKPMIDNNYYFWLEDWIEMSSQEQGYYISGEALKYNRDQQHLLRVQARLNNPNCKRKEKMVYNNYYGQSKTIKEWVSYFHIKKPTLFAAIHRGSQIRGIHGKFRYES